MSSIFSNGTVKVWPSQAPLPIYDVEIRKWVDLEYASWVMTGHPPLPWGIDKTVAENDYRSLLHEARQLCCKHGGWIFIMDERAKLLEVWQWKLETDPDNVDVKAMVEIQHDPAEFQGRF